MFYINHIPNFNISKYFTDDTQAPRDKNSKENNKKIGDSSQKNFIKYI